METRDTWPPQGILIGVPSNLVLGYNVKYRYFSINLAAPDQGRVGFI